MNKEKCIILSYAPIKSNFEFTFWNRFCCLCISFGYSVYYIGPIAFPNSMVNSYIVPRNLEDVYNALSNEILYDIIDRKMVDICYRREKAFMKRDGIKSFLAIHKILTLFRNINLAHDIKAIVAWTRITPTSFLIWEYAKKIIYHALRRRELLSQTSYGLKKLEFSTKRKCGKNTRRVWDAAQN